MIYIISFKIKYTVNIIYYYIKRDLESDINLIIGKKYNLLNKKKELTLKNY